MQYCRNCGDVLRGNFCSSCGEKKYDEKDYTLKKFVNHTIDMFTHFDGKFFRSMKYLLFFPGKLTEEYLSGRRVRFMKPLQLYIITGLAFFFLFKEWDIFYSRTRYIVLQKPKTEKPVFYREGELRGNALFLKNYIAGKAKRHGLTFEEMVKKIDTKTPDLSKALVFLLIPVLGLPLYFIGRKKYKYYAQHLYHATHLFTFYLATNVIWVELYILFIKISRLPVNYAVALGPVVGFFAVYAFFSIKSVYKMSRLKTFGSTVFFMLMAIISVIFYAEFITYFSAWIA